VVPRRTDPDWRGDPEPLCPVTPSTSAVPQSPGSSATEMEKHVSVTPQQRRASPGTAAFWEKSLSERSPFLQITTTTPPLAGSCWASKGTETAPASPCQTHPAGAPSPRSAPSPLKEEGQTEERGTHGNPPETGENSRTKYPHAPKKLRRAAGRDNPARQGPSGDPRQPRGEGRGQREHQERWGRGWGRGQAPARPRALTATRCRWGRRWGRTGEGGTGRGGGGAESFPRTQPQKKFTRPHVLENLSLTLPSSSPGVGGWMDGWMDGRTDRRTDRCSPVVYPSLQPTDLPTRTSSTAVVLEDTAPLLPQASAVEPGAGGGLCPPCPSASSRTFLQDWCLCPHGPLCPGAAFLPCGRPATEAPWEQEVLEILLWAGLGAKHPLMRQLLRRLGQLWAAAPDSAAWCLPLLRLETRASVQGGELCQRGRVCPRSCQLGLGDLCPHGPIIFTGFVVIPGGEAALRGAGQAPHVLLGV